MLKMQGQVGRIKYTGELLKIAGCAFAALAVGAAAWEDFKTYQIKNMWMLLFAVGNFLIAYAVGESYPGMIFGICPGIFLLAVSKASKGKLGEGDSWIVIGGGISLGGWNSLAVTYLALTVSCIAGFIRKKRTKRKKIKVPFVPAYLVCYLICISGILWNN